MTDPAPVEVTNLDRYGSPPLPWSRPHDRLVANPAQPGTPYFLGTSRPDGRPHAASVGAQWLDGDLYFTSGPGTRKARNLAANPASPQFEVEEAAWIGPYGACWLRPVPRFLVRTSSSSGMDLIGLTSQRVLASVSAGQELFWWAWLDLHQRPWGLSAKCREPLCGPPFPQVASDRRGQGYGFNPRAGTAYPALPPSTWAYAHHPGSSFALQQHPWLPDL
jgi:hypothetical protein